jgi:ribosomal protein L37AE/L43A
MIFFYRKGLKMPKRKYETNKPRECPKCGSIETRFIEPRDGMLIFDCNKCGCEFEAEQET